MAKRYTGLFFLAFIVIVTVFISFYISADIWSGKYGMYTKISGSSFHPEYSSNNKPIASKFNDKVIYTSASQVSYLPEGVFPKNNSITNAPKISSQITNLFNDPNKASVSLTKDDGSLFGSSGNYEGVYTYLKIKGKWYFISTIIFEDGSVTQTIYAKVE